MPFITLCQEDCAVTKAAQRISEQMETERGLKKETDQVLYSIFKVCPPYSLKKKSLLEMPENEDF